MSDAYSRRWRAQFTRAAQAAGVTLHEGVYAGLLGPQYETPAEVRMLQKLGADAVGMSTVLETIQALARGLEVAGFSCLTNLAAGMGRDRLGHANVLAIGEGAAAEFCRLLAAAFAADQLPFGVIASWAMTPVAKTVCTYSRTDTFCLPRGKAIWTCAPSFR